MKSFDVAITPPGHSDGLPYMFGDRGGVSLSHSLGEPSAPTKVDTILIQSLHHGAGRKLSTDPNMYRDTNGQAVGCDTRQIGYIMPGGKLTLIKTVPITQAAVVADLKAYAAGYVVDDGSVKFGIGRQLITIDISNDAVTTTDALAADKFFTGSVVKWNLEDHLGVVDIDGVTLANYNATASALNSSADFMFSWAVSTRNGLFWIRNRTAAVPQMRWSDGTDTDFTSLDPTVDTGNVFGPFSLEITKPFVTGMGVAGVFAIFASKGGDLWAFNSVEVFQPLSPPVNGGFEDLRFAGPMAYVGNWLLVPTIDGLLRFDPRTLTLTDVSPSVHQNATPTIGSSASRQAQTVATGPTGALVVAPWLGSVPNVLLFEMYQDGMFFHCPVFDPGITVSRYWGSLITRKKDANGDFTSQLRAYLIAADATVENWKIFRLDLATSGWQPGPENLSPTSGLRTAMYAARPPDVSVQPTGVRTYAQASSENYIEVAIEVDDTGIQYALGRIEASGPAYLPMPANVPSGRRFALAFTIVVGNESGTVPYIALPLSLDYRFSLAPVDQPNYVVLKLEASSDQVNKLSGFKVADGRNEADFLVSLGNRVCEIQFGDDPDTRWQVMVEDANAELMEPEDGIRNDNYLVSLTCRRLN